MLLHLVDANNEDVGEAYRTVRDELDAYGAGLEDKPEVVALNKADTIDDELAEALAAELEAEASGGPVVRGLRRDRRRASRRCSTPLIGRLGQRREAERGRRRRTGRRYDAAPQAAIRTLAVTGGTGFVGAHLLRMARDAGPRRSAR